MKHIFLKVGATALVLSALGVLLLAAYTAHAQVRYVEPDLTLYAQGQQITEGDKVVLKAYTVEDKPEVRRGLLVLWREGSIFPETITHEFIGGIRGLVEVPVYDKIPVANGNYKATLFLFNGEGGSVIGSVTTHFSYGWAQGGERGPQLTDAKSRFLGFNQMFGWQITLRGVGFGSKVLVLIHRNGQVLGPYPAYPTTGDSGLSEATFLLPYTIGGEADILYRCNLTIIKVNANDGSNESSTCTQCLVLRSKFE